MLDEGQMAEGGMEAEPPDEHVDPLGTGPVVRS